MRKFKVGDVVRLRQDGKVPRLMIHGVNLKITHKANGRYWCCFEDTPETTTTFPDYYERWLVKVKQ